jgi:hypothetical protein
LYSIDILDGPHLLDGLDLFLVGFDPIVGDHEAKELTLWDLEHTLLGVEHDAKLLEVGECLL